MSSMAKKKKSKPVKSKAAKSSKHATKSTPSKGKIPAGLAAYNLSRKKAAKNKSSPSKKPSIHRKPAPQLQPIARNVPAPWKQSAAVATGGTKFSSPSKRSSQSSSNSCRTKSLLFF